jgi:hypothetical protein
MALSTTQSIWRSGGGDNTRTAVCGTGIMAAQFFIPDTNTASDNVQASSTNTSPIVLPANAIVTGVIVTGDGGAAETFDLGYAQYDGTGTPDPNGYVATGAADAADTIAIGAATAGAGQGVPVNELVYVTGGGTLTAGISGFITYFVLDPLAGQQNV